MPIIKRPGNWLTRMMILIILEKLISILAFAWVNFTIPFGIDWIENALMIIPALLVIDIIYGRIVIYSAAGAFCHLGKTTNPFLEAGVYLGSLTVSIIIGTIASQQAKFVLFSGGHVRSDMATQV